jgi:hypothetical protein
MCTLVGQAANRGQADAAGTAGDDGYAAFETAAVALAHDSSSGISAD